MEVLDKVGIWGKANDNHLFPEFAFAAQSQIKQRVGFYDRDVPGMTHCNRMIRSAMSFYQLMMDEIDRPDLHAEWRTSREEKIERALTSLEEELRRQGIRVS
jgi:hypothetical protein